MFNLENVRNDFPMIKNNPDLIYFDNGATTFKPQCVIDAVNDVYTKYTSNIHRGDYDISYKVSTLYDNTRNTVCKLLNCDNSKEIVFTSGATESLNLVAYGYGLHNIKEGTILLTHAEHASNILPWFDVVKINHLKIKYIPLNDDGTFNIDKYRECFINDEVKIVALPIVSNVLGYKYPIKEICKIAHENNALVSADGAQAVPHCVIDVKDIDVDFLSFSSHKMCGPSGVGVLYGKYYLLEQTKPLKQGGGANARYDDNLSVILKNVPEKFEAGTPNIEGIIGFNKAIEYLMNIGMNNIENHDGELVKYLIDKLLKLDNVTVYNPKSECSICAFNINGIFAQDSASYLNKNNIAVRTGNHCAKILHHVIGTNETIRASLYFYNTKEEIDKFVEVVKNTTLEKCIGAVI